VLGYRQSVRYELKTSAVKGSESGDGAPLGWYKVTVITQLPGQPEIPIDARCTDVDTTPLSVEVVDNPPEGAYDFKVTR
jgi:hypothetical protein